jgi:hypothetical protein
MYLSKYGHAPGYEPDRVEERRSIVDDRRPTA